MVVLSLYEIFGEGYRDCVSETAFVKWGKLELCSEGNAFSFFAKKEKVCRIRFAESAAKERTQGVKRYAVSAPRKLRDAFPLDPRERAEHTTRDDACGAKPRALTIAATSDRRSGRGVVPQNPIRRIARSAFSRRSLRERPVVSSTKWRCLAPRLSPGRNQRQR